jgi:predicted phage terminase large subunit-like protein
VQFVDTAFKTGVGSDYSVIATWATDGVDFYVLDIWRKRVEYPDLKRAITSLATVHKPRAIFIEDRASGQSVIQDLRVNTALPIIPFQVGGSKEGRADAVTSFFEAGKVVLPSSAPWVDDFIEEHIAFPNGAHDDQVDCSSAALKELALKGSSHHAPLELVIARDAKRKKGDSTDPHWKMLRAR